MSLEAGEVQGCVSVLILVVHLQVFWGHRGRQQVLEEERRRELHIPVEQESNLALPLKYEGYES